MLGFQSVFSCALSVFPNFKGLTFRMTEPNAAEGALMIFVLQEKDTCRIKRVKQSNYQASQKVDEMPNLTKATRLWCLQVVPLLLPTVATPGGRLYRQRYHRLLFPLQVKHRTF